MRYRIGEGVGLRLRLGRTLLDGAAAAVAVGGTEEAVEVARVATGAGVVSKVGAGP